MASMNGQLIAAKKLAALLAAGGTAASGTPAAPVEPVEPAPKPPVEIVEEAPSENETTDLENQAEQAIDDMEKGEAPVIIIDTPAEDEGKPPIQAPVEDVEDQREAETGKTELPAETPKEDTEANAGKTLNHAQMALLKKLAAMQKTSATRNNTGGSYTVPAPSVTTGNKSETNAPVIEDAKDRNASVTKEQKAAVDSMLEAYPSGTTWNDNTTYRGNTGCGAYVTMMADKVYGQKDAMDTVMTSYVKETDIKANIKPYSVAHVYGGTHWVFILDVYEDGTVRVAEGNVGGRVSIGAIYDVDDIMELYVK